MAVGHLRQTLVRGARWLTARKIGGNTESARGSERNRRAIASSVASLALSGSSLVTVFVTVPLTLGSLGAVRFGLWMTIASVISLLAVTNLGIGNGVLNSVSRAFGSGDELAARSYISSGLVGLAFVALLLAGLFAVVYPAVPWSHIYNVTSDSTAASEAGPATAVFVYCFLVNLPLGLVTQIRAAYQEGFLQSLFSGAGNVLSLVLVVLAVSQNLGLPAMVLAMSAGPIVAACVNYFIFFAVQRPWLIPRVSAISRASLRAVLGVGLAFLALQISYAVGFSSDRFVAAVVVGPVAAGDYSVVSRMFAIPAGLAVAALTPLWPAYAEAIANRDVRWARATLWKSQRLAFVSTVPLVGLMIIVGPTIVTWWTGGRLNPSFALYPSLGAFTIVFAVANVYAMLLNGAQVMKFLILTMTTMAVLNILISIYLASTIGVAGVALGSVVAVCGLLILPDVIYTPWLLSKIERLPREVVPDPADCGGQGGVA